MQQPLNFIGILFWCCVAIVFYTYIGYGILLYFLVRIKEIFFPPAPSALKQELPEITLLIAAYNEANIIKSKMANCHALNYPADKFHIIWVTDGSTDRTNDLLSQYPEVTVCYTPARKGKTAALNHGMPLVKTPFTVFTDANTMLNPGALKELVKFFSDPRIGCVAGEKRIAIREKDNASSGGEGFYWKYESKLKAWDSRLYSTVGAAGELYAIRTELFEPMPEDTLLDDFILSMRIACKGYRIAYCNTAYAIEEGSADMQNEEKRKVRIAAGGLQAIGRLRNLLLPDPFHTGILRFQYISHRVLRWSLTPVLLFLCLPLNIFLTFIPGFSLFYGILLLFQLIFYGMGILGYMLQQKQIKVKILFIPYYFLFMNLNVIKGFFYLHRHRGKGTWEKAQRNTITS